MGCVCESVNAYENVPAPPFNVFSLTNIIPYARIRDAFSLSGNLRIATVMKQRIAIYSIRNSEAHFSTGFIVFIRLPITFSAL